MWPVAADYNDVLAGPHEVVRVADVMVGGAVVYADLPVVSGSITVDSQQRVRRQCSLTIAPALSTGTYTEIPALAATPQGVDRTHPLRWTGPEIRVKHGLVYPSGAIAWVPVGVFRIESGGGSLLGQTAVQVTGASRESWLIDDNRDGGVYVTPGGTATSLIRQRILATAANAQVLISTRADRIVPASSADDADAWATVERLARSIGCVAYCDADGRFIIADRATKATPAVTLIRPGAAGTLVSADGGGSRTDVVAGVTVTGATSSGAAVPVSATVMNTDPTSPTRAGDPSAGLFGWKMLQITDSSLTNVADCQRMAASELAKRTGVATAMDLSTIPMPHLEAGDVIDVAMDADRISATLSRHVVDRFTLDLTAGAAFPVATRDLGQVAA